MSHGQPRPPRALAAVRALLLTASLAACGADDGVVDPTRDVASVTVTAPSTTLAVGATVAAQATARDAAGSPLSGRTVAWSSTNDAIATVSSAGRITATAAGLVRIAAVVEGRRGELQLTVIAPPPPPVASVTVEAATLRLATGQAAQLVATPRDASGAPIAGVAVSWSVTGAGAGVVSVSAQGVATGLRMGHATVAAHAGGHGAEVRVTVLGDPPADLLFEEWGTVPPGSTPWPGIHRLDLGDPDAAPARVIEFASDDVAVSPEGTRLAYVCDVGGPDICVANADGSGVTALPGFGDNTLRGDQPSWSPDGGRIAFRGWASGGPAGPFNPSHVWVMNADGSGKARLTPDGAGGVWYDTPAWSPALAGGGSRVAYSRRAIGDDGYVVGRIHSMRDDGGDARAESAAGEHVDDAPAWSPDGRTIAFVRTGGTASGDVWVVGTATGAERPLMAQDPAGAQRAPAWSPDGALVAFASEHEIIGPDIHWQIYTVGVDGTGVVRRTSSPSHKGNPAWLRRR